MNESKLDSKRKVGEEGAINIAFSCLGGIRPSAHNNAWLLRACLRHDANVSDNTENLGLTDERSPLLLSSMKAFFRVSYSKQSMVILIARCETRMKKVGHQRPYCSGPNPRDSG